MLDPAHKTVIDAILLSLWEAGWTISGKPRESAEALYAQKEHAAIRAMQEEIEQLRKTVFMTAAHCQGNGSEAGKQASEVLGVPFPIHMPDLIVKAMVEGWDPVEVWPWHPIAKKGAD